MNFFPPDWSYDKPPPDSEYWDVMRQITDQPSSRYSVHRIALKGVEDDLQVGEWFGPSKISCAIR